MTRILSICALLITFTSLAHADPWEAGRALVKAGDYAKGAAAFEAGYTADSKRTDLLFNAAFYKQRAGDKVGAKAAFDTFLSKVDCRPIAKNRPRVIRHCAIASQGVGELERALLLFERFQQQAGSWKARSRAHVNIELIKQLIEAQRLQRECAAKTIK